MPTHKKNLHEMMCLDVFLMSLPQETYDDFKSSFSFSPACYSLISLDILSMHLQQNKESTVKEGEILTLLKFAQSFNWQLDLQTLLGADYSALVLTNTDQQIQWVNKGFTQMSGYSRNFAIGKKPYFLQGEQTCQQTRIRIREMLAMKVSFTEKVINYRKNGEAYLCQVNITPIFNKHQELTHFIALEKELHL